MKVLNFSDFINKADDVNSTEKTEKDEKPTYDYGCVMVYFDFPELKDFQSKIREEDLKEDSQKSLETEPHVTLLYGLHSDEIDDEKVMESVDKSLIKDLKLCNVSAFENEDVDVLKFEVKGEGLHENNENLKKLPFTNNYPDYEPHSTIAYLKPGAAKKYVKMFKDQEFTVTPSELVYSKPGENNNKNKIKEKFDDNSN